MVCFFTFFAEENQLLHLQLNMIINSLIQNFMKRKSNLKSQIFAFGIILFCFMHLSTAYAQNTYVITGSGWQFTATKNSVTVGVDNVPIQTVIDFIKTDADGNACTIQFEDGTATLDIGTAKITFDSGSGADWGLITLTGKILAKHHEYQSAPILLKNSVFVNSQADITHVTMEHIYGAIYIESNGSLTISDGIVKASDVNAAICNASTGKVNITGGKVMADGGYLSTILNNSSGEINISGGIISSTGNYSSTVYNTSTGEVIISGGEVSASGIQGIAIYNNSIGKITVSGDARVISANQDIDFPGTIYLKNAGTATDVRLEITGGTVENTADGGIAVYNNSTGAIDINGGAVKATGDFDGISKASAVVNFGTTTISGGTVEATGQYGIAVDNHSTTTITGGSVEANGELCIALINNGSVTISGGTVQAIKEALGTVVNMSGTVAISGGMVRSFMNNGCAVYNQDIIQISGGMVLATTGFAVINNSSTNPIEISGGIVFAYGTEDTDVIDGDYDQTGDAVIVAWDNASSLTLTYEAGSDDDLKTFPEEASAVWANEGANSGISVLFNTNEGFIPIDIVTVEKVGIDETHGNASLQVYPNPTTGELRIETGDMRYEIYDVYGRMIVIPNEAQRNEESITINISRFPAGIYFITLQTEQGIVTRKIIKI
jgi:hypothetical protein